MPGLNRSPVDNVSVQDLLKGTRMGRDKFDRARAKERRTERRLAIEKLFREAEEERVEEMKRVSKQDEKEKN